MGFFFFFRIYIGYTEKERIAMREQKNELEKRARKALLFSGAAVLALFLLLFSLKYLLPCVLPFLLSLPTALLLRRPAERLSGLLHLPKKISAAVLVFVFYSLLLSLLFFCTRQIFRECSDFLSRFLREQGGFSGILSSVQGALSERFPFLRRFFAEASFSPSLAAALEKSLSGILDRLTVFLPSALASAAGLLPETVLFIAALLLCSIYLTAEFPKPFRNISERLPERLRSLLPRLCRSIRSFLLGYAKTAGILFLLSFALLYVGFLFLHIRDPFFLAWLIALIDLLPILGLGTVLLPWGLFLLCTGDPFRGFGLFILYGISLFARQLLMPHLLTKNAGLSPILTVLSLYAGYKCAGIGGMLAFPLLASVGVSLYRGWRESPAPHRLSERERKRTQAGG